MASSSPLVPAPASKTPVLGFLKPQIDLIKSFFTPTTTPPPMSEKDIMRYLYQSDKGIQSRLIDSE
ncbi:MAG TPA: hypothetical protein VFC63_08920 [Blastocatellia bacterium]|nr:hypothetical protein [Blastocatellia bacterium]